MNSNENINKFPDDPGMLQCPVCGAAPLQQAAQQEVLACRDCHAIFPLLENSIPVLLRNPIEYLSNLCLLYEHEKREMQLQAAQVNEKIKTRQHLANKLSNIRQVYEERVGHMNTFQQEVLKHITSKDLLKEIGKDGRSGYLNDYSYLRRDWCWLPEGEAEISKILSALSAQLDIHHIVANNMLVLGAGTGRISWELRQYANKVYAVDKSYSMLSNFIKVLQSGFTFKHLNTKLIASATDIIRMLRASLSPVATPVEPAEKEKIFCLVADAQQLPFADNTFDAIVAVYFTDVLPLSTYLSEIKRVLKPQGIFIHFGPLDYHFADIDHYLSLNEVYTEFMNAGFDVHTHPAEYMMPHLHTAESMVAKYYKSSVFTAVNKKDHYESIHHFLHNGDAVLEINGELVYEMKGLLSKYGENIISSTFHFPDGEVYEGAFTAIDILKYFDGQATVTQILERIQAEFDITDPSEQAQLLAIVQTLLNKNVITKALNNVVRT